MLDYNHTKISWEPVLPETMQNFYDAFLHWRSDAGMDNEISDNLSKLFEEAGLTNLKVTVQSEMTKRSDNDFQTNIAILAGVASFKGIQMVNDGFITENQRARAENDFRNWINESAKSQTMYLLAVEGTKKELNLIN